MLGINRIADYVTFAQGVVTAEGDNQVLLGQCAGHLMTERTTPDSTTERRHGSLADPIHLAVLLSQRSESLIAEAAARLRSQLSGSTTSFARWNHVANRATEAARMRGLHLALKSLIAAADSARTPRIRRALSNLATIYGLRAIDHDSWWYLHQGLVPAEDLDRIPELRDDLCDELKEDALLLVDGFGLTNKEIRAPIASDEYITGTLEAMLESLPPNSGDTALHQMSSRWGQ